MPRLSKQRSLAARKSWQERAETWREKIKVSAIINRLGKFVDSYISPKGYVLMPIAPTMEILSVIDEDKYRQLVQAAPKNIGIEMTPSQVKASQVLLDRVMPTLSASEITRKTEAESPQQLIQMLRERYGDEFAATISKDYVSTEHTHEPGHA